MSKMIQIRHVPDTLHRRLHVRAAAAGMTLSDYLKTQLEVIADRLTPAEIAAQLTHLEPARVTERPASALRAERDRR